MGTVVVFAEKTGKDDGYGSLPISGAEMKIFPLAETAAVAMDEAVDLAIIDCGADAEAGLCLLRELKQDRVDVPVILITDTSSDEVGLRAFKNGAREYFKKPLDTVEFTGTVQKILRFRRYGAGKPLPDGTKGGCTTEPFFLPDAVPERFQRVIDYMEKHIAPLYLDELARQACLSKYYFCRQFKKLFGMSPIRFMLNLHVCQAGRLLRETAIPICQVALNAGFSDLSEFNKQFKKLTGFTPSVYRKLF